MGGSRRLPAESRGPTQGSVRHTNVTVVQPTAGVVFDVIAAMQSIVLGRQSGRAARLTESLVSLYILPATLLSITAGVLGACSSATVAQVPSVKACQPEVHPKAPSPVQEPVACSSPTITNKEEGLASTPSSIVTEQEPVANVSPTKADKASSNSYASPANPTKSSSYSPPTWKRGQSTIEEQVSDDSFTLAILPDTQFYSEKQPGLFLAQTAFLANQVKALNIKYVLHLGDLVQSNVPREWKWAKLAMDQLEGKVPYAITPGNHDYGPGGTAFTRNTFLNKYFSYQRTSQWKSFGGSFKQGELDNTYHLFSAGGKDYIILALEWGPRDSVIAWAN